MKKSKLGGGDVNLRECFYLLLECKNKKNAPVEGRGQPNVFTTELNPY